MDTSIEERFCRYCHEDETVAPLISPCDCKGSSAFIHKNCVLKWILVSELTVCELCNAKFRCKPSRWSAFKKFVRASRHEALCYAIVFVIFMAPVLVFKTIADCLRYNEVLTYEEADRLLTGGLFGTYLLLIVFGVLFVAIWVHRCHDDEGADAATAPDPDEERQQRTPTDTAALSTPSPAGGSFFRNPTTPNPTTPRSRRSPSPQVEIYVDYRNDMRAHQISTLGMF